MKQKYKLYDNETGEPIPPNLGQCYADDNTVTFGGPLGQLQVEGRLEFRLNDDSLTLDEQAAAITEKYRPKLDSYKDLILNAMATDGASQAAKISSFQQKFNALLVQKNNELEALYNVD
jgi:hypothetical protein